ncbi:MAG: hypothetical protein KAH31_10820, partial [Candidatus Sabulitectum sp.]|nr:hypothetical protein [Candidatus Sabulitectum sp.]
MNGDRPVSSDTRKRFRYVVDSTAVSNKERRAQLASIINETREKLLNLLNMQHDDSVRFDWSITQ